MLDFEEFHVANWVRVDTVRRETTTAYYTFTTVAGQLSSVHRRKRSDTSLPAPAARNSCTTRSKSRQPIVAPQDKRHEMMTGGAFGHPSGGGVIRISFVPPTTEEWAEWLATCQGEQQSLNAKVVAGTIAKAKKAIYGKLKESVYANKSGPFAGKCAFCETEVYSAQHADIEHFRPKGAIKDENDAPIRLTDGSPHPGYYWLAYDFTNLLLSCQLCNQPSTGRSEGTRIGKWNAFPLVDETKRAQRPGEEVQEEPILINPTQEDPALHLGLDPVTGVLFAVNASARGEACIEVFGLNSRGLPALRRKKYEDVQRLWRAWLFKQLDGADTTSEETRLREVRDGRDDYAIAGLRAVEDSRVHAALLTVAV
jgi:hypothetical protein